MTYEEAKSITEDVFNAKFQNKIKLERFNYTLQEENGLVIHEYMIGIKHDCYSLSGQSFSSKQEALNSLVVMIKGYEPGAYVLSKYK